jgi:hypothetical protein
VLGWLISSFLIHFLCLGGFAVGICGCHFHPIALVLGIPPLIWAGYTLTFAKTMGERILAYSNLLLAAGWIYLEWDGNVRFYGW